MNKYTDDELIDALRRAADQLGRAPIMDDLVKMKGFPTATTYRRRFGSWAEALRKAKLMPSAKLLSNAELIQYLMKAVDVLGRTPSWNEFASLKGFPRPCVYRRRFGSWNEALERAGLDPVLRHYSNEELIEALRETADILGRAPGRDEFAMMKGFPSPKTVRDRFGSWAKALKAAGFTPPRHCWEEDELLDHLKKLAGELGRTPIGADLKALDGFPNPSVYHKHFGSWVKALRAAGLSPVCRFSDSELIEALQKAAHELGHTPRFEELRTVEGSPDPATIKLRFGTWQNALLVAGLIDRKHGMTLIGKREQRVIAALDNGPKTMEEIALDENMEPSVTQGAVRALARRGIVREVKPKTKGGHVRYVTVDEKLNEILEREHKVFEERDKDDEQKETESDRIQRIIVERHKRLRADASGPI